MDQKSSEKREVDPLPKSESDFWKDADVNVIKIREKKCKHFFDYSRVREGITGECMKCHAGYILNPGMHIKKGHIYLHGSLII